MFRFSLALLNKMRPTDDPMLRGGLPIITKPLPTAYKFKKIVKEMQYENSIWLKHKKASRAKSKTSR